MAGIAADPAQPGFKHIIMKPTPVGDLYDVTAWHHSPYGKIVSSWTQGGSRGTFAWQVEIPPNTTATVTLPTGKRLGRYTQDGKPVTQTTTVGAGKYRFTSE